MSRAIGNRAAFQAYRYGIRTASKDYQSGKYQGSLLVAFIGAQCGVPLPFATEPGGAIPDRCALALAAWLFRYLRRRSWISGGGGGYGDPLADTVARDILIARNRARDEQIRDLPEWDAAVLEQARRWMARAHDLKVIDVKALNEVHSYGPSLRRLWADARSCGGDPWEYIRTWALHIPKAFACDDSGSLSAAAYIREATRDRFVPEVKWRTNEDPAVVLGRPVEWRTTEDPRFPWAAEIDGQSHQVRLNDFPDEWMYSLLVKGIELGDFHDWPAAWTRGKSKLAARPRAARAPKASRPAASDIDPAQLLPRYQNGEHEQVWRDLETLGADVRHPRYLKPAQAVARETMRRARLNIETIVGRLRGLNYRFIGREEECDRGRRMAEGMAEVVRQQSPAAPTDVRTRSALTMMDMVGKLHAIQAHLMQPPTPHRPFVPPAAEVAKQLKRIERKGFVLPLSLAAWAVEVGSVDLTGAHPALCFVQNDDGFPNLFADPLVVYSAIDGLVEAEEDPAEGVDCPISPDEDGKAGEAECGFYSVRLPDLRADTTLKAEHHNTSFVNYLRLAF